MHNDIHNSVPGPIDRETFFSAQARHRRATRMVLLLCLAGVLCMGIPLSMIITPALWAGVVLVCDITNIFIDFADLYTPVYNLIDSLFSSEDSTVVLAPRLPFLLLVCCSTGSICFLVFYWQVRRLVFSGGSEAVLEMFSARPPDLLDLEEKQLVNIVEEMALAAGIEIPKVAIYQGASPNGALIGRGRADATVMISRKLLDDFNRDETQGVVGHLIGSLANDDLRISLAILSLSLTVNTALVLMSGTTSRESCSLLRRLIGRSAGAGPANLPDRELLSRLLRIDTDLTEDSEPSKKKLLQKIKAVFNLPIIIMHGTFLIVKTVFMLFLLGPLLAWLWRTRCYLADAAAVQLTRNPDGLAQALGKMTQTGALLPGAGYLSHLFIVGIEAEQERTRQSLHALQQESEEVNQSQPWAERFRTISSAYQKQQRFSQSTENDRQNHAAMGMVSLLPPLSKRLQRLRRMGATGIVDDTTPRHAGGQSGWLISLAALLVLLPLAGLALMLVYAIIALATMLGLGAGLAILMFVLGLVHPILRML